MSAGRFRVRAAERKDASLILAFIRELADYEKLGDQVSATEEKLLASLFTEPAFAEVLIAEAVADNGAMEAAGFALYFHNYSTFLGQPGIFLEDLFVRPAFRGLGIGVGLLRELAKKTVERNCGRLDWMVLDWNEPAIDFYHSIGARRVDEFMPYRLSGDALQRLAKSGQDG
ncbi:MAG: GNAT family N-acetyltransferase [Gammaproteobacteria bacterium]|nr:GNAT family N-acetyltransferase [Gammaproteobacteria bacterium]MCZ6686694.1 GNAT family N-acetyltransferase [Gammaproteobacteria bacterium]MCZ6880667.1 GNAT family N-acetyltransferase [Gammaproteobacteria bacterium]